MVKWSPEVGPGGWVDVDTKCNLREMYGDALVEYVDCSGGYTTLHM